MQPTYPSDSISIRRRILFKSSTLTLISNELQRATLSQVGVSYQWLLRSGLLNSHLLSLSTTRIPLTTSMSRVEVRLGRVTSSDADLLVPTRCPGFGGGGGVDFTPVTHRLHHIVSQYSRYQSSVSVAITPLLTLALPPASPPPPTVWVHT